MDARERFFKRPLLCSPRVIIGHFLMKENLMFLKPLIFKSDSHRIPLLPINVKAVLEFILVHSQVHN